MNSTKFNDWLQIAAAVGVIAGLLLVAYEIRVSNRVGVEQANAARFDNWAVLNEQMQTEGMSDLFVRAHEGDQLSRTEVAKLMSLIDTFVGSLNYIFVLYEMGSVDYGSDFGLYHRRYILYFLGSDFGRRYWARTGDGYGSRLAVEINKALSTAEQRDVLADLDFIRGATEQNE